MSEKWVKVEVITRRGNAAFIRLPDDDGYHPQVALAVEHLRDDSDFDVAEVARQRDALRDRVAELERETGHAKADCGSFRRVLEQMAEERDEARRRVAELEGHLKGLNERFMDVIQERDERYNRVADLERWSRIPELEREKRHVIEQRDEARRRVAEARLSYSTASAMRAELTQERDRLRAENERLRAVATWDEVAGPVASPDQPAPQTHYQAGDVVREGESVFRLSTHRLRTATGEQWYAANIVGPVTLDIERDPILARVRDGVLVPTDEGLEDLAGLAFGDGGWEWLPQGAAWRLHNDGVYLGRKMSDALRRRVADHMDLHAGRTWWSKYRDGGA